MKSKTLIFGDIALLRKETINPKEINQTAYLGLEHINQNTLSINSIGSSKSLESNKFIFSKGDILFGKLRPYFRKVYRPNFDGICSTDIWVVQPKSDSICKDFLFYLMADKRFINFANQGTTGTRMPRANWEHVSKYEVNYFSYNEQREISKILRSLDNKIDINRKMNENLEEISKTLFKSWFIDFDPVRAKAEGRGTGFPKEISDLFPDSFEDSELGKIPKNYKVGKLEELAKYLNRGVSPSYVESNGVYLVNQKCIRNGIIDFNLCKQSKEKSSMNERYLEKYDILLNSMGVGTLGRVAMFYKFDKKITADALVTIIKGESVGSSFFIYYFLERMEDYLNTISVGSTGQTSLKKDDILDLQMTIPPKNLLDEFGIQLSMFAEKKYLNNQENLILRDLRDTLLPKLISGELKVSDAENLIEEASIK